ncbi:MAG: HAMP domain-containing protein [Candidatus Hydrogenedentes bacterium]|nr:HAMP domain-containing protein [Candidatus Hydrogenedentota bacterium]
MGTPADSFVAVRWYQSLIFRAILLCAVLLLCLMGSVYVITRFYYQEIVQEMETQAQEIADSVVVGLGKQPQGDLESLEREFRERYRAQGLDFDFKPFDEATMRRRDVSLHLEDGQLTKTAQIAFPWGTSEAHMTISLTISPVSEILRAFQNKYLVLLTLVFLIALGSMVYFMMRILRPLSELSDTCAKIGMGTLREVSVRKRPDEIQALEQTFNRMVGALREKELVETKLRQAQRLSAVGNLAAGVAHDIRNPLNAIKLLSSHALDSLRDRDGAEASTKHLQTIREEVNRLEGIVSQFLSLAKETELQPEPCRVDTVLEACARLVKQDAEERGVRLITELRAGDTTLHLDPKQWTRAVLNVLINALEACAREGRVRMFSRVTDTTYQIEIRDDGTGMSKDVAERAFDPYFTTKRTGTGLGLSITRGIVEEHGGSIQLSTVEGGGCQVLITLPLHRERATSSARGPQAVPRP